MIRLDYACGIVYICDNPNLPFKKSEMCIIFPFFQVSVQGASPAGELTLLDFLFQLKEGLRVDLAEIFGSIVFSREKCRSGNTKICCDYMIFCDFFTIALNCWLKKKSKPSKVLFWHFEMNSSHCFMFKMVFYLN